MGQGNRRSRGGRASSRATFALPLLLTLVLGVAVGWLLFGRDSGGEAAPDTASAPTAAQGGVARKAAPGKAEHFPVLGLTFRRPTKGWKVSERGGVIKLSTSDGTISIAASGAGGPQHAVDVRRYEQAELLKLFKPAHVVARQRGKIGTLPSLSTEIAGTTKQHRPIRILTTAMTTRYRTYSVQVFSTPRPPAARLAEVRTILDSFRFAKPTA